MTTPDDSQWSLTQVGTVCAAIGTLFGVLLNRLQTFYRGVSETRLIERKADEDSRNKDRDGQMVLLQKGNDELNKELRTRIEVLAGELREAREEACEFRENHLECERKHERLSGQHEMVVTDMKRLSEEVMSIRRWRHDIENSVHVAVLQKAVADSPKSAIVSIVDPAKEGG